MTILKGGFNMKNIINVNFGDDKLVPMEEWDGKCWKTMFDTLAKMIPEQDPWETFANFIKETLMK